VRDLNRMTAAELVSLHNARCPAEQRITKQWKASKRDLIERIGAIGEHCIDDRIFNTAEQSKIGSKEPLPATRTTVGTMAETLLSGLNGLELTYEEIATQIRRDISGSTTTAQCVRWYASKIRQRGGIVRVRRSPRSTDN